MNVGAEFVLGFGHQRLVIGHVLKTCFLALDKNVHKQIA